MLTESIELNNNTSKVAMQSNLMLKKQYMLNNVKNIVINT